MVDSTFVCDYCGLSIPLGQLESHRNDCIASKIPCQHCGQLVHIEDLDRHEAECIAQRTESVDQVSMQDYQADAATALEIARIMQEDVGGGRMKFSQSNGEQSGFKDLKVPQTDQQVAKPCDFDTHM